MSEVFKTGNSICPSCGAESDGSKKYCSFCGTLLQNESGYSQSAFSEYGNENRAFTETAYKEPETKQSVFTESAFAGSAFADSPFQNSAFNNIDDTQKIDRESELRRAAAEVTDTRKVDIVALDPPMVQPDNSSAVVKLIMWVIIGLFIVTRFLFGWGFIPSVIGLVIYINGIIKRAKRANKKNAEPVKRGRKYNAVVIDHSFSNETIGTGVNQRTVTNGKLKVLANINGRETCILIPAGDGHIKSMYPVGCTVTIQGYANFWTLAE